MAEETIVKKIGVFVVAENRLLRDALTKILNRKNEIEVLLATDFSPRTSQEIVARAPDVLLLDSSVSQRSGVQIVRDVRESLPDLKVIMVGMDDQPERFLQVVSAGIAGYILKDAAASEVAAAVRSVVRKHAVWPGKLCFALLEYVSRQSLHIPISRGEHRTGLSRREQQLLQRVSCGLTASGQLQRRLSRDYV